MEFLPIVVHVGAGTLALASGAAALSVEKGERLHRVFGTAFFVAMLATAGFGAYLGVVRDERLATFPGLVTLYLAITAWATVRRPEGSAGLFETGALVAAAGLVLTGIVFAVQARNAGAASTFSVFAAVAAIAAVGDLRMVRRGGLSGHQRIARHLWRMCAALVIAAFSFFIGQQKVMPEFVRGSPLLFGPPLAVLALMIFWLVYVRRSPRFSRALPS